MFNSWTLIYLDLFFIVDDIEITSCADDNTLYVSGKDIKEVIVLISCLYLVCLLFLG